MIRKSASAFRQYKRGALKVDDAPDPIPSELSHAFHVAVQRCADGSWSPAQPDVPTMKVEGKDYTARQVCEFVTGFSDTLPDEVLGILLSSLGRDVHSDLMQELAQHRTYAVGARCLLTLIDRRIAKHKSLEDRRKNG
jgi:hypothetical protein